MNEPSVEERLAAIESRNANVTADKAWETSLLRRGAVSVITYFTCGFMLILLGSAAPWFYAFIPVVGYLMSTLTLPLLRRIWQRYVYENHHKKNS
jgi:hypothetical protein